MTFKPDMTFIFIAFNYSLSNQYLRFEGEITSYNCQSEIRLMSPTLWVNVSHSKSLGRLIVVQWLQDVVRNLLGGSFTWATEQQQVQSAEFNWTLTHSYLYVVQTQTFISSWTQPSTRIVTQPLFDMCSVMNCDNKAWQINWFHSRHDFLQKLIYFPVSSLTLFHKLEVCVVIF